MFYTFVTGGSSPSWFTNAFDFTSHGSTNTTNTAFNFTNCCKRKGYFNTVSFIVRCDLYFLFFIFNVNKLFFKYPRTLQIVLKYFKLSFSKKRAQFRKKIKKSVIIFLNSAKRDFILYKLFFYHSKNLYENLFRILHD